MCEGGKESRLGDREPRERIHCQGLFIRSLIVCPCHVPPFLQAGSSEHGSFLSLSLSLSPKNAKRWRRGLNLLLLGRKLGEKVEAGMAQR